MFNQDFMKLSDIGEFKLIQRFAPLFHAHFPSGVEGIGDDCAVIPFQNELSYLVTTDLLNENTHFIKDKIEPLDLGYKSLAVNLSDIAAMGGKPLYAFLSLGLPPDIELTWMDEFFAGFRKMAEETGVLLLGGDTTRSEHILINVLLVGTIETALIKRRSAAQSGDFICCTHFLGDSAAGLKILLDDMPRGPAEDKLIQAHIRPHAQLEEGKWLSHQEGVHAMMDISDGIASDLHRLLESSQCGARVEIERLPLSPELLEVCLEHHWKPETFALSGGEDYALLVTVAPDQFSDIQQAFCERFQRPLFQIGKMTGSQALEYILNGQNYLPEKGGFDHFNSL
jgi:thiamine-monophosphate kinase